MALSNTDQEISMELAKFKRKVPQLSQKAQRHLTELDVRSKEIRQTTGFFKEDNLTWTKLTRIS